MTQSTPPRAPGEVEAFIGQFVIGQVVIGQVVAGLAGCRSLALSVSGVPTC